MASVRVRFAPSPTGYFHVGSARSALFNWLFARQQDGTFILRIEDTDIERNQPEHVQGIQDAMRWLGLEWDEGPYFQSDRVDRHQAAIDTLLSKGLAYACDCTPEALAARARERNGEPGYDGFCRDRGLETAPGRVVRFRTPDDGVTVVQDLIRGRPEFANANIEDFAIRKSSGQPSSAR
jgi:glutamyl-tRNA synthetase